jgi:hypothetical protein
MEALRSVLNHDTLENKEGVIIRDGGLRRGISLDLDMMGIGGHAGYLPHVIHNHEFPDGFNVKYKQPVKMETKVFMVEMNDILSEDNTDYRTCSDLVFIKEASRQSEGGYRVFTLPQFQDRCNRGETSIVSGIIRFIEMAKVINKDSSGSMK